jgi:hypothetical protein
MLKLLSLLWVFGTALSSTALAGICDDPLRHQETCYKMKSLASQIEILDAQRDLMQVNFPLLQSIGGEVQTVVKAVREVNPGPHMNALASVDWVANQLASEAERGDVKALSSANKLKNHCLACHSPTNPISGIRWQEISAHSWDSIVADCHSRAANPYLCKSMHGMRSVLRYYMDGYNSGVQTFVMMKETAREIKRIATDLIEKGFFHGSTDDLEKVKISAEELLAMANAQDPMTFPKASGMSESCLKCHRH